MAARAEDDLKGNNREKAEACCTGWTGFEGGHGSCWAVAPNGNVDIVLI